MNTATAADNLRATRIALGVSQSLLSRLSRVSRFKISSHELGDGSLSNDEQKRIREALHLEAGRLRRAAAKLDGDSSAKSAEVE
jgi:hypothetical protein